MKKSNPSEPSLLDPEVMQPEQKMAVQTQEAAGVNSGNLMTVLDRAARDPQCDVEKMERILNLIERVQKTEAETKFNVAMAACQAELPAIYRDAQNTSTNSRYARLETVSNALDPIIHKHGFSLSYGTADCPREGHYRIICEVSLGGHRRLYQLDLPNDSLGPKGTPNKTLVHGAGSSLSYGRRYLKMMIFDATLTNEDDDANAANRKPQNVPGKATERTRAWFLEQISDIAEQAKKFLTEHALLAPDEPLSQIALEHVPVTKAALATFRKEVLEWVDA